VKKLAVNRGVHIGRHFAGTNKGPKTGPKGNDNGVESKIHGCPPVRFAEVHPMALAVSERQYLHIKP